MIGTLAKIIRTSNSFKNVLRYLGKVWHKSNLCILLFYWLIALYIFTPLPHNTIFLIIKHSCVREELSDIVFFFRNNFDKSLCKNIFLVSFHFCNSPLVRAPHQLTLSPSPTTCAVDYFRRLIFSDSQSPNKFIGNSKIVCHPTSSQERLNHKSMFTFTFRIIYPYMRSMARCIVAARGGQLCATYSQNR